MKGIILAGGTATRFFPASKALSKQIMPVYDKPMIYYPLSVLMLANINKVLIISTPHNLPAFQYLLGDGENLGMSIKYVIQKTSNGIAQAFVLGENFIENDSVCLILGDNIFYGQEFSSKLLIIKSQIKKGAHIFGHYVKNPKAYGVVNFDSNGKIFSIEEKPNHPKSHYAIPGLYFYDHSVVERAKKLKLSTRGEYEITDLNKTYLREGKLTISLLKRGFTWLDAGNSDSLLDASCFIATIQRRQGIYIACIEEIAWKNGWINFEQLQKLAKPMEKTEYGQYLLSLIN